MPAQTVAEAKSNSSAVIKVDVERVNGDINDFIYSGFAEHMGRCIYGGIVDYDNKHGLINEKGHRTDVMEALKNMKMPLVRYPGGNFCAQYHWLDGVGPKEKRPTRPDLAWKNDETNLFGTDEFMEWCEEMGCEPYLCFNMGTGTLEEALAWVEYCNLDGDSYYAKLRRQNGRLKPYNVKYWGLGNEIWGEDQVEHLNAGDYAKRAINWAKALKRLDPSIVLVGCNYTGFDKWDIEVTPKLIKEVHHYSIHLYSSSDDYYKNVTAPAAAEIGIEILAKLIDLAKITEDAPNSKAKICFDEWNVWNPPHAQGDLGAEQKYDLSDALAVGSWLNVFVRQAEHLFMANIAQIVNVISPILTKPTGMVLQTTYYPFVLFSEHMRGRSLNLHVTTPLYKGETEGFEGTQHWLQAVDPHIVMLDVSATINGSKLTIAVVNRSLEDDITTSFAFNGKFSISTVKVWTIYDEDVTKANTFEEAFAVVPKESETTFEDVRDKGYSFPKHSFSMLQFSVEND
ncbi:glycoside hydrolase superfamily [Lipomyces doorenjongii]|uniref:glycoside hydrolase superfamily n=1 Tax=Lipomyces doorenjongii TaxID=383834 RepID=UPI0034CD7F6C